MLRGGARSVEESKVWTINVGGWPGLWRLVHLLKSMTWKQRPTVVCVQEVACGIEDWLAIQGSFLAYYEPPSGLAEEGPHHVRETGHWCGAD